MPRDRSFLLALGAVMLAAFCLRAAYVMVEKRDEPLMGDAIYYSAQANTIADGRWFEDPFRPGQPAADHPPLTALALAPVSLVSDGSVTAQRLGVALFGSFAVGVIGALGSVVASHRGGLIAAVIAALHPGFWVNDGLVMSEAFATLASAGVLLAVYRFHSSPSTSRAVLCGAALGVAVLARAELALLGVLAVVPLAFSVLPWRTAIARAGVVAGATALVLAPWTAYNLSRFERPVLVSTNDGLTWLGANCPAVYSGGGIGLWTLECADGPRPGEDQSEVSARYRAEALDFVREHADRLPAVIAARVGRVWNVYKPRETVWYNQGEGREAWASWAAAGGFYLLVPLSVAGAVVLRRRRSAPLIPLLATFVIVTLVAMLFYGLARFRVPSEVAMVVLAGVALDAAASRWRPARSTT